MNIIPGSYAVFWRFKNSRGGQFHADIFADNARHAFARFSEAFPKDVVCSIRDESGKFLAFK